MARLRFSWDNVGDGLLFKLSERRLLGTRSIAVEDWVNAIEPDRLFAVGHLLGLAEQVDQQPPVRVDGDRLWVANEVVAALTNSHALALELPSPAPLMLGLQSRGNIAQPTFEVSARWLETGAVPASGASVEGCLLRYRGQTYRIPEPLYSIWWGVARFRETDATADGERFRHLAALKDVIPDSPGSSVETDPYIRNTKVVHAAAFSLRLQTGARGFQVEPVLFGRRTKEIWTDSDGEALVSEAESLLPDALQEVFAKQRFPEWNECRDRYGLGNHYYVYVEPELRKALSVVRKVQKADVETRRNFARNPQAYLREALGDDVGSEAVDHLFIATEQYSQRVLDLGIWQPTVLPWLKREPNTWLPEKFGVLIGDKRVELSPSEIAPAHAAVQVAMANQEESVSIGGHSVPATEQTLQALAQLLGFAAPIAQSNDDDQGEEAEGDAVGSEPESSGKMFLVVDENYEEVSYHRDLKRRATDSVGGVPQALLTSLKVHQEEGLSWLQSTWRVGFPGVLLADDMGLGKTLSALAFMAWLAETRARLGMERQPMLVIAPTGLLANWVAEHERHLAPPGLGEPLLAFGTHLKMLRDGRRGKDVDLGQPLLDSTKLQEATWILTTYETLRDYHLSFAKVRLAAAVYDEVQKLKNPTSQLSRAAKTVNTDFSLAMTGTPVENRLEDLWAIMDIAYPGYLGDLKNFSQSHPPEDMEALRRLRARMLETSVPTGGQDSGGERLPAVMLRRMKADRLPGLPEKRVVPIERRMPGRQAEAYADAINRGRQASGRPGGMLETLHALRGISLHPIDPQQAHGIRHEDYVAWSARLAPTFEILRKIAADREKALIFVESLDMQDVLAVMLKREFGLPRLPMLINGSVAGEKRQRAVDDFQKRRGEFDVMILSPKAGGVGLTLTAANHVIHLSRWWNPAVEDQCTDRIYRIGQGRAVHVYYPMAVHPEISASSFDLKLNALLERKRALSRDLLVPPILPGVDEAALFRETVGSTSGAPGQGAISEDALLDELDRMTPVQFENWALRRLQERGFRPQRTPTSNDGGADGIAVNSLTGQLVILQCKHRQGRYCDASSVDDLLRARNAYDAPFAQLVAMTTAKSFTAEARERASRHGIILIARDRLAAWPSSLQ